MTRSPDPATRSAPAARPPADLRGRRPGKQIGTLVVMDDQVTPFRIAVPEAELEDLRDRLARTRWPEKETVDDWSQGIPLADVRELCRYWAEDYDWRAREARLNTFPQFRTAIVVLGVHFVHVRSPHPGALPLVMTHG